MERLDGFRFDDAVGMREAGVDTGGWSAPPWSPHGRAMISGFFHGDLQGGNLLVLAEGAPPCSTSASSGGSTTQRRVPSWLMVAATTNDLKGQIAALRDLGALPADTDLRAVIRDLGLDQRRSTRRRSPATSWSRKSSRS